MYLHSTTHKQGLTFMITGCWKFLGFCYYLVNIFDHGFGKHLVVYHNFKECFLGRNAMFW